MSNNRRIYRKADSRNTRPIMLAASTLAAAVTLGCNATTSADGPVITSMPDPCKLIDSRFVDIMLGGKAGHPKQGENSSTRDCSWIITPGSSTKYPQGAVFTVDIWKEGFGGRGTPKERVDQARGFYARIHTSPCTQIENDSFDACWQNQPSTNIFVVSLRIGNIVTSTYLETFQKRGEEIPGAARLAKQISSEIDRNLRG